MNNQYKKVLQTLKALIIQKVVSQFASLFQSLDLANSKRIIHMAVQPDLPQRVQHFIHTSIQFITLQQLKLIRQQHCPIPKVKYSKEKLVDLSHLNTSNKILHHFQSGSKNLWLYRPQSKSFIKEQINLDVPFYHRSVSLNQQIYLLGGLKGNRLKHIYKLLNKQLQQIGNMLSQRSSFAITSHANLIFIVGGINSLNNPMSQCQFFNIQTNECSKLPSLNHAARDSSVIYINGKLIKYGGYQYTCISQKIQMLQMQFNMINYQFREKKWISVQLKIEVLMFFSMVIQPGLLSDGKFLFVFGGYTEFYNKNDKFYKIDLQEMKVEAVYKTQQMQGLQCEYIIEKDKLYMIGTKGKHIIQFDGMHFKYL